MNRIDLYLGKTIGLTTLLASAGLVGLFVIFTFLDQMEDIKNDYTIWRVIQYIGYSTPRMFYETVPYATLIGCLTGLGLLANNSELIVMRAAGVSTWQISWAVMKPTLAFVFVGLLIGEYILPDFERTARAIREEATEDDITPQGGFWYRESNVFMHFNAVSHRGRLQDINHYYVDDNNELTRTLWAAEAMYDEEASNWLLTDVTETDLVGRQKKIVYRDQVIWETSLTPQILSTEILVEPDKMSILELRNKIEHLRAQGLNTGKFEIGYYTKMFQPVACISLVLVAISFIFGPLRETTMGMRIISGLIIGILFKFAQDLLSPASLVFGFPPLIATLVPILVCVGVGYSLLKRAN